MCLYKLLLSSCLALFCMVGNVSATVQGKPEIVPAVRKERPGKMSAAEFEAAKAELEALKARDVEGKLRVIEEERAKTQKQIESLRQDLQQNDEEQKKIAAEGEVRRKVEAQEDIVPAVRKERPGKISEASFVALEALKDQNQGQRRDIDEERAKIQKKFDEDQRAIEKEKAKRQQRIEVLKQDLQQNEADQKKIAAPKSKYAAGKERVNALKAQLKVEKKNLKMAEARLGFDLQHKKSLNDSLNLKTQYSSVEQQRIDALEEAKAKVRAVKKELRNAKLSLKKEKIKKTVKGVIKKVMPKKKTNAPKNQQQRKFR